MVFRQNYVIYMELRFVAIRSFGDFVKRTTGSLSKRKNLTTECTGNTEDYVSAYSQCTPSSTDIVRYGGQRPCSPRDLRVLRGCIFPFLPRYAFYLEMLFQAVFHKKKSFIFLS